MQQERQFTVTFNEKELQHIGILVDHKSKSGYEDGLAGAQCSLSIVAKLNEAARVTNEAMQRANGADPQPKTPEELTSTVDAARAQ
jgi:hypothetical protein